MPLMHLVKAETAVTAFAFLLPDLVDMPLWILGTFPYGRYLGHTLLFAFVAALVFSVRNRVYGLLAICAGMAHLLLDSRSFMPWLYPFKTYDFPNVQYHGISWHYVAFTLLELALVTIVVSAGWELLGQGQRRERLMHLLRPEMAVTVFAFLLPDLIDKPLWMMGVISDGRYIGHTLLLTFLVALVLFIWKRVYGLCAICGGMAHLFLDIRGFMPWFYPFKSYEFPSVDYHGVITWYAVVFTVLELACAVTVVSAIVSLVLSYQSWASRQCRPEG